MHIFSVSQLDKVLLTKMPFFQFPGFLTRASRIFRASIAIYWLFLAFMVPRKWQIFLKKVDSWHMLACLHEIIWSWKCWSKAMKVRPNGFPTKACTQHLVQEGANLTRSQGNPYEKPKSPRFWPFIFWVRAISFFIFLFYYKTLFYFRAQRGGEWSPCLLGYVPVSTYQFSDPSFFEDEISDGCRIASSPKRINVKKPDRRRVNGNVPYSTRDFELR